MALYDCIVIGGGAAGMLAAIELRRSQKQVLLIEQNKELGKKLLATGNGRCNFTNSHYDEHTYRGDTAFANAVLEQFEYGNTLLFMQSIGVLFMERDGYYYPYTNQSKTVVHAMRRAVEQLGVELCLDRVVRRVQRTPERIYHVTTSYGEFDGKCVLFACGGISGLSPKLEAYHGYEFANALGHQIKKPYPALCALQTDWCKRYHLKGIRAAGAVTIAVLPDGGAAYQSISPKAVGELQFADYGVSGIPAFEVSRYAAEALDANTPVYAVIDLFPEYSNVDLRMLFQRLQFLGNTTVLDFLSGYVQTPLAVVLLEQVSISQELPFCQITKQQMHALLEAAHQIPVRISSVMDFAQAQVTAGGVETRLIHSQTMESQLSPGAFFAGEMLDVDGTCGGYNLQFAFGSAHVAVKGIKQRLEKME